VKPDTIEGSGANGGEPSVLSSLEHLVAGSQGVITKRIDLALLDGREALSRALQGAALVGVAILVGAAAWLALTAGAVEWVLAEASWALRLAAFGLLNAATAAALLMLAARQRHSPPTADRASPKATMRQPDALMGEGKS